LLASVIQRVQELPGTTATPQTTPSTQESVYSPTPEPTEYRNIGGYMCKELYDGYYECPARVTKLTPVQSSTHPYAYDYEGYCPTGYQRGHIDTFKQLTPDDFVCMCNVVDSKVDCMLLPKT